MKEAIPIGTVCRIREWDDMALKYGSGGSYIWIDEDNMDFIEEMKPLCGRTFTVKAVCYSSDCRHYNSEEDLEHEGIIGTAAWVITDGMLEIVDTQEDEPIEEDPITWLFN